MFLEFDLKGLVLSTLLDKLLAEDLPLIATEVVGELGTFGDVIDVVVGIINEVGNGIV
jgi:hypothetical protein